MKVVDAMGTVNFSNLCVHPNLKLTPKFKMLDFQKYNGKSCPMACPRLYGVAMTQYSEPVGLGSDIPYQLDQVGPHLVYLNLISQR